jgi:hypothetical protein
VLANGGLGRGKRNVSKFLVKELRCLEGIPLCITDSRFDRLLTVLICFKVSGGAWIPIYLCKGCDDIVSEGLEVVIEYLMQYRAYRYLHIFISLPFAFPRCRYRL